MLCCEWSLVKHGDGETVALPLKCRRWTCDYCHPWRKAELTRSAQRGHPNTFITLTVNPDQGTDPDDRARSLAHAWRRCVRAAKRKYGYDKLPFLAVFETTKNGEPHLHILARCKWIDHGWLSRFMAQEIGAPVVDIRRVRSRKHIAFYIAKYVGKEPHRFTRSKRYWSTRDWQVGRKAPQDEPELPTARWEIHHVSVDCKAQSWSWQGYTVSWEGSKVRCHGRAPP